MRFSDSLDRQMEEIKRPPNLPIGHYIWQIAKHPDIDQITAGDGTEYERLTFQLTCVSPTDDVDPTELEEFGNVTGQTVRKTFMFNNSPDEKARFDQTLFQVKQFLENAGVDPSMSMTEGLAACVGGQIMGELRHRPSKDDPEVVFQEIGRTAAAE